MLTGKKSNLFQICWVNFLFVYRNDEKDMAEHSVGENSFLLPLSVIIKKKLKEMGKEKHWNGCSMNWKYVIFTIQWFKDGITHEEHHGRMEVNTFN